MANKITQTGTTNVQITESSKDATYVFKDETVAAGANLNFILPEGATSIGFAQDGDDLNMIVLLGESGMLSMATAGAPKIVVLTIKDYYKYVPANLDLVTAGGESITTMESFVDYTAEWAAGKYTGTAEGGMVIGGKKANTYDLSALAAGSSQRISDLGGNDTYNIRTQVTSEPSISPFVPIVTPTLSPSLSPSISPSTSPTAEVSDITGNDKYNVENANLQVYDITGKDKYNIKNSSFVVRDYAGNDKYTVSQSHGQIYDLKGKDKYDLNGGEYGPSVVTVTDLNGNDSYKVKNMMHVEITDGTNDSSKAIAIESDSGNDKYDISYTYDAEIEDYSGNDKYKLTDMNTFSVYDYAGKDTYTVENLGISDDDSMKSMPTSFIGDYDGNDKYTVKNSSGLVIQDGYYGEGAGGNDQYTVKNSERLRIYDEVGKDKYDVSSSYDFFIGDLDGDDTYKISKSGEFSIYDGDDDDYEFGGNDKYTVKKSEYFNITDYAGDDKYTVENSQYFGISDYTGNDNYTVKKSQDFGITDYAGDDNYTIKESSFAEIEDLQGDDTYKFDNLKGHSAYIYDESGNDKLVISGLKASNVVFGLDVSASGVIDNDLLLFDKNQTGFIAIEDFYSFDEGNNLTSTLSGCAIESIYAGKKDISNAMNFDSMTEIASQVAGWLTGYNSSHGTDFGYASDFMASSDVSASDKAILIAIYNGSGYSA